MKNRKIQLWLFEAFLKTMNLISHPEFLISEIKDLNRNQKIYFKSYAKEEARFSNCQRQSSFVFFKVLGIISRIKLADCSIKSFEILIYYSIFAATLFHIIMSVCRW